MRVSQWSLSTRISSYWRCQKASGQATGGARRQVESSTTANGKMTFGRTRHGVKGVFCTEVRTNDEESRAAGPRGLAYLGLDVYA